MVFFNNSLDSLVTLYVYMLIYNLSLLIIFWTFQQFISTSFKTIYSFNDFKLDFFFVTIITIILFSIAGVPPFIGFFSKIIILLLLANANFFFFYIFFFGLLFFGLYFYIQNIRFLYSTAKGKIDYAHLEFMRKTSIYFVYCTFFFFIIMFGLVWMDDIILYVSWLFS